MIDSHSVSLSWNSLSAPNAHHKTSVGIVIALPFVYELYLALSCFQASNPVLSCDVLHDASSVSMYKHAQSVAQVPTLVVALNQECTHQAWWDTKFLEPLQLVRESRVPLCDVGFELEGDVFVVASILVVSTSNVGARAVDRLVWSTCVSCDCSFVALSCVGFVPRRSGRRSPRKSSALL